VRRNYLREEKDRETLNDFQNPPRVKKSLWCYECEWKDIIGYGILCSVLRYRISSGPDFALHSELILTKLYNNFLKGQTA
jgi:hypothetical protein